MFVCGDPSAEPFDPAQDNTEEWVSRNDKKGSRIIGHRLDHVRKAKTVRVRKGQLLVTDGPFAETSGLRSPRLPRRRRGDRDRIEASDGPLREDRGETALGPRLSALAQ